MCSFKRRSLHTSGCLSKPADVSDDWTLRPQSQQHPTILLSVAIDHLLSSVLSFMKWRSSCWFTHSKETSRCNLKAVRQRFIIPSLFTHIVLFFRDTSPHVIKRDFFLHSKSDVNTPCGLKCPAVLWILCYSRLDESKTSQCQQLTCNCVMSELQMNTTQTPHTIFPPLNTITRTELSSEYKWRAGEYFSCHNTDNKSSLSAVSPLWVSKCEPAASWIITASSCSLQMKHWTHSTDSSLIKLSSIHQP